MRTFIAVELSEEQKNKLAELQLAIKNSGMDAKIVEKENLHITLKFLGEIEKKDLETIKESLEEAVEGIKQFTFSVKGAGAFPGIARPRVIWAGIDKGGEELVSLAGNVENKIILREFDSKPFSPHITVARLRSPHHIAAFEGIIGRYEEMEFGEAIASEVKLKKSELSPKGPVYSDLLSLKLA